MLLLGIVAACSSDVLPTAGYYPTGKPKASLTVTPVEFMTPVGCTPVASNPDTGGIAIPVPTGRPAIFSCKNVRRAAVNAARLRYYAAVDASIVGPHLVTNGYWALEFVGSREWCYADGAWGSDGLFHLTEGTSVYGCFTVDTYRQNWVNTSGNLDLANPPVGGGGPPTGDPQPPLPPPPPPPVNPDTACTRSADAQPIPNTDVGQASAMPSYGPLGSLTIQNGLFSIEEAARTSGGPERGGYITAANGSYTLHEVPNSYPPNDLCDYGLAGGMPSAVSPAYIVAFWHTHPAAGTALTSSQCPRPGTTVLGISAPDVAVAMNSVNNATTPGVSEYTNTNYVVQREANGGALDVFRYGSNHGTYYANDPVQRSSPSSTACAAL